MIFTTLTPVTDNKVTGDWHSLRREQARLSLREVARRMGFSAPYISDLERGRRNWTEELSERYTRALKRKQ